MAGLGDTVSNLLKARHAMGAMGPKAPSRVVSVIPADSNPGHLRMFAFVPPGLPPGAPLVVALHGCTQTASGYDAGSGWSTLAQRHGFALLLPEQDPNNNANKCFNWFQPEDVTRGRGEVQSIAQMVEQMVTTHRLDRARVYVTGLSAGGAMTSAMLATYPELFAGGAIIAGLPYGAASGMPAAFEAMRNLRDRDPGAWGDLVRRASPHRGPFPSVQIWHGDADSTVRSAALGELVKQWADVLGVSGAPSVDQVDAATHQAWAGPDGRVVLESYLVPGLGHGVPLRVGSTDLDESVGATAPFMLEAGISSTWRIARSWGLLTQAAQARAAPSAARARAAPSAAIETETASGTVASVTTVIQNALRAAGLKV